MPQMEIVETGVLIVGGGGAAARAALEASDKGARVLMAVKGRLGHSGATVYPVSLYGTFQAYDGDDPGDSIDCHYQDILAAAQGACDPKLARILADESPASLKLLEDYGVPFQRLADGRHFTYIGCFATRPRSHRVVGHGEPIMAALTEQIRKRDIRIEENVLVERLLVQDGRCIGAVAVSSERRRVVYLAKAAVLATGGAGQLFKANLNPRGITGDGYLMAYRAGAELINMEFMQTGIAIVHPLTLLSPWTWAFQPTLVNDRGEEFLPRYLPANLDPQQVFAAKTHFPFSSRDDSKYLEIAILQEMRQGRDAFFDLRQSKRLEDFKKTELYNWLLARGLDMATERAQISVYGQAINGGVLINEDAASTLPGLYAAGEVAGGAHGADRLGGGMLSNCQVFGARAGTHAARYAQSVPAPMLRTETIADLPDGASETGGEVPESKKIADLKKNIRTLMFDSLLIERNREHLSRALTELDSISRQLDGMVAESPSPAWDALELRSLIDIGNIMVSSALYRDESRGSHYRSDCPETNDNKWRGCVALRQEGGKTVRRFVNFENPPASAGPGQRRTSEPVT